MFYSCSKWTTSQQCRGSCWSLSDWCCCWRRALFVFLFVEQNGVFCRTSHLQVVKRCRWKGSINAHSKNSVYIQLIIFPVEFNVVQIMRRDLIPACVQRFLCTYTSKYFVPQFMCSLLVGVTGTRARWLFKNCCLRDKNQLQAAKGFSWELIVISWTRSFKVRVTESGPKSRDHSIPPLGTQKIMLL